ncbi:aminotransferase class IV [Maricaulis sp.]|uniref:aminotransferase class IV n=1 Tax=Maricaulis sp. TaxID=1486257 RepID=UPI003A938E75
MTVWLDGEWLGDGAAVCPADDRGLLLGDGLFETLRFSGGRLLRQAAHEQRLRASCAALELACPLDRIALSAIVGEMAARAGLRQAAIRLTLTAGSGQRGLARPAMGQPSCLITAAPLPEAPASISLANVSLRRSTGSVAARHKTLSYIDNAMARREAVRAGAGMALLLDTDGHLSGTDCANLFWVRGGRLFTPALECAVLPGTVRAAILAGMDVEQGRFTPDALADAQSVFVTNALMGAVAVTAIDGAPAGRAQPVPDAVLALLD